LIFLYMSMNPRFCQLTISIKSLAMLAKLDLMLQLMLTYYSKQEIRYIMIRQCFVVTIVTKLVTERNLFQLLITSTTWTDIQQVLKQ
jgi:hypothetical protein